jgi:hypothetical protein
LGGKLAADAGRGPVEQGANLDVGIRFLVEATAFAEAASELARSLSLVATRSALLARTACHVLMTAPRTSKAAQTPIAPSKSLFLPANFFNR